MLTLFIYLVVIMYPWILILKYFYENHVEAMPSQLLSSWLEYSNGNSESLEDLRICTSLTSQHVVGGPCVVLESTRHNFSVFLVPGYIIQFSRIGKS